MTTPTEKNLDHSDQGQAVEKVSTAYFYVKFV